MAKNAFELTAGAKDFSGGTVSLPRGESFDVGVALSEGDGKIVLDPDAASDSEQERKRAHRDGEIIEALSRFPALKNTTVGDAEPLSEEETKAATNPKKGARS